MTVIVKMMGNVNAADSSGCVPFTLHILPDMSAIEFDRDEHGMPAITIDSYGDGAARVIHRPRGNTYVMDNGRTIASFSEGEFFTPEQLSGAALELKAFTDWDTLVPDLQRELTFALLLLRNVNQNGAPRKRWIDIKRSLDLRQVVVVKNMFKALGFNITFEDDSTYLVGNF